MVNVNLRQASSIMVVLCFSCAEKFRVLESNKRIHDQICVEFGVPASVHAFQYKDRLTTVTVDLMDRPEARADTVKSAVQVIVRKEFPKVQSIVVNIPPTRLPTWSPQNMLASCPERDVQADAGGK